MVIERLSSFHDRESFFCGEESLDNYLKKQARQDMDRNLAVTYIATLNNDSSEILGYYTLTMSCIKPESVPNKHIPPHRAVPVILLGRLAVSINAKGKGYGKILLMDSLRRSFNLSQQIGSYAVIVDALNDNARNFYLQYGFKDLGDNNMRLYITINSIKHLGLNPQNP